ncbi:MAG TPA: hypothetical protein VM243_04035 [Phycisphaerae bacterium]|nr:hypothetical protein [Phycisphaerae bacterium]
MTGAQIRTALNSRLSKSVAVNGLNTELTLALQAIARLAQWPDLHKTDTTTLAFTVGLKSKALPSDFRILDRLYRADDSTLAEMEVDALRAYQEVESATTGEPTDYAIIGGSVYLWPIPDASYTIRMSYWYNPAAISDETAALPFGDEFQEAMITGTIVAYLKTSGFSEHPKLAENQIAFDREIFMLMPVEDRKVTAAKAFNYGR